VISSAIYFKKIAKASHESGNSYEKIQKPRKLQSSPSVREILELPSLLAEMKKQNPTNYRPI